jgi:type 1 fimbria pilin
MLTFRFLAMKSGSAHVEHVRTGRNVRGSTGLPLVFFLLRWAFALCVGMSSLSAHANLTCEVASVNKILSVGTNSVSANTPVGTVIVNLAPDPFQLTCNFPASGLNDTSATLYADLATAAPLAPGYSDVYQTSTAGLGVRYLFTSAECKVFSQSMASGTIRLSCPFSGPLNGPITSANVTVQPILIVIGKLPAGVSNLSSMPVVTITFRTSDGGSNAWAKSPLYTGSAYGTITSPTCSVSVPSVAVAMPAAEARAFSSGVGAVAAPQAFSLSLSCVTGATVSITLTDNVNPANRGTALNLTKDSTAKGIGVQILNSVGTPIAFGPDSSTPGNTNQWKIGASPNGTLQVPLTARYVRTGNVSPGSVKALATFTMSYQ